MLEAESRRQVEEILRVAQEIPFYREHFGAAVKSSDLRNYPVLKRSDIPALNRSVRDRIGSAP